MRVMNLLWCMTIAGAVGCTSDGGATGGRDLSLDVEDVTPPALVGMTREPAELDVRDGPARAAVTLHLTDDLSGVDFWSAYFYSPSGLQYLEFDARSGLNTGTPLDGEFVAGSLLPRFSESGLWTAQRINVTDRTGNTAAIDPREAGFSLSFSVVSNEDLAAPVLTALSGEPAVLDVTGGPAVASVTLHMTDDASGVSHWALYADSPSRQHALIFDGRFPSSGTATDGTWTANATLPPFSEDGVWIADRLYMTDFVGRTRQVDPAGLGMPLAFEVVSHPDKQPPRLLALAVEPRSVDASQGPVAVTATAHIVDDLSGLWQWSAYFYSPSRQQYLEIDGVPGLVHGTLLDGTYVASASLPRFAELGTWRAIRFSFFDRVENIASVDPRTLGIDAFFNVCPTSGTYSCDDGDPCTLADACVDGTCQGTALVCPPIDVCHAAGACDPSAAACTTPALPDGTPCDDGDPGTIYNVCVGGTCV